MAKLLNVGIIGGNGIIGGALARGLVAAGIVNEKELALSCRSNPPDWLPQANWMHDNDRLVASSDVVVISVRPDQWGEISIRADDRLIISVMAGVPITALQEKTGSPRVVRALPNAAADVGASYTPWTATSAVNENDRTIVSTIFGSCGVEDEVENEQAIDYFGGTSGTGPAYPALLVSAMIDDAVEHGISRDIACRAAVQLLIGSGRLFEKTGEDPAVTVQGFIDYAGITATAIKTMRNEGFEIAVKAGLAAALAQTVNLTK